MSSISRRTFLMQSSVATLGMGLTSSFPKINFKQLSQGIPVGIIGLDTSHSIAFAKLFNDANAGPEFGNYRVVAAYPKGSKDIESSVSRIPRYTKEIQELGVKIVDSISELLKQVEVVLLETNDGRPHLVQAMQVIEAGKPVFIDKPVAGTLKDAITIYKTAKEENVPVFSASSLRYIKNGPEVRSGELIGKVLGADTFSPAKLEPTHPDLFWYGIHGVETLYTVMGTGCKTVKRIHTPDTDIVVGEWEDGRLGTFRGTRTGKHLYGGTAYGEKGNQVLGPYNGYQPLVLDIVKFFQTKKSPVDPAETIEIYSFMEAADESKRRGGETVKLEEVIK